MRNIICDICGEPIWSEKDAMPIEGLGINLNDVCGDCRKGLTVDIKGKIINWQEKSASK